MFVQMLRGLRDYLTNSEIYYTLIIKNTLYIDVRSMREVASVFTTLADWQDNMHVDMSISIDSSSDTYLITVTLIID